MNLKDHPDSLADFSDTNAVIPATLFMLDRNWRITDINATLVRLIDLEQDKIVGRQLSDLLPGDRIGTVMGRLASELSSKGSVRNILVTLKSEAGTSGMLR